MSDEWQPIETADPEKEILGFQATPGDNENRIAVCWPYVMGDNVVWMGHGGLLPTHWMPLPKPPRIRRVVLPKYYQKRRKPYKTAAKRASDLNG